MVPNVKAKVNAKKGKRDQDWNSRLKKKDVTQKEEYGEKLRPRRRKRNYGKTETEGEAWMSND
jgi:hypothetical protein